jgi:hypothetical protein
LLFRAQILINISRVPPQFNGFNQVIFINKNNGRVATIQKEINLFGDVVTIISHGNSRTMKKPVSTYYESSNLADNAIQCFKKLRVSRGYELIEDQISMFG